MEFKKLSVFKFLNIFIIMKIGSFSTGGKGFIYELIGDESKKIPWTGDYHPCIIDASGYKIREINKEDGVPIIEKKELTQKKRVESNIIAEALLIEFRRRACL